jgi:long-chain acyl-CoA synthetase
MAKTPEPTSIAAAFEATVARAPGRTSLVFLGERYTAARVDALAGALAGALSARGVAAGSRVIVYLPHSPQWVVSWLAVQKLGAIAVPVTPFYGAEDLRYIATDSGAETAICADTNFGHLDRVRAETPLRRIVVTRMADLLPAWKRLVGHALDRLPSGKVRAGADVLSFGALVREGKAPPPCPAGGESIAQLLYTGGTTGFPKGVPMSHALLLEAFAEQRSASVSTVPAGEELVLQGAPLHHILGQAVGLGAVVGGETVVLLPRMNLDAVFDHVQRYRATTILGTPTFYRLMLEHERIEQYDLTSLRFSFCGGDALPKETARRWQAVTKHPLYQGYGATETAGGVALCAAGADAPAGSVGRACAHQSLLLVDPATLEPVPDGEPGELLVASRHMVQGYWNKPEETARCFVTVQGRLWYRTGDVLRRDGAGWLYFHDRSVDVIKHKGYRVAASKIDNALHEHPAVIASCTIGVPDDAVGERIKSYVVVRSDVKGVQAQELVRFCRERLAPYEVPQYVEFRDMLPKSKAGKILRRELRDEERRKRQAR